LEELRSLRSHSGCQLALRTSVSSTSVTVITPGAGCSITSTATVSTTGVTGGFTFRAAFFTGAGLGFAVATVRFGAFAALAALRALPRLAEFPLRSFARFCTFDPFLRLAMIAPAGWWSATHDVGSKRRGNGSSELSPDFSLSGLAWELFFLGRTGIVDHAIRRGEITRGRRADRGNCHFPSIAFRLSLFRRRSSAIQRHEFAHINLCIKAGRVVQLRNRVGSSAFQSWLRGLRKIPTTQSYANRDFPVHCELPRISGLPRVRVVSEEGIRILGAFPALLSPPAAKSRFPETETGVRRDSVRVWN
jgi:hypothetical protein